MTPDSFIGKRVRVRGREGIVICQERRAFGLSLCDVAFDDRRLGTFWNDELEPIEEESPHDR